MLITPLPQPPTLLLGKHLDIGWQIKTNHSFFCLAPAHRTAGAWLKGSLAHSSSNPWRQKKVSYETHILKGFASIFSAPGPALVGAHTPVPMTQGCTQDCQGKKAKAKAKPVGDFLFASWLPTALRHAQGRAVLPTIPSQSATRWCRAAHCESMPAPKDLGHIRQCHPLP